VLACSTTRLIVCVGVGVRRGPRRLPWKVAAGGRGANGFDL